MADIQSFTVVSNGNITVNNFPRFTITAKLADSNTGEVIADYTGANSLSFPADVLTIFPNAATRRAFATKIAEIMVKVKAGVASIDDF